MFSSDAATESATLKAAAAAAVEAAAAAASEAAAAATASEANEVAAATTVADYAKKTTDAIQKAKVAAEEFVTTVGATNALPFYSHRLHEILEHLSKFTADFKRITAAANKDLLNTKAAADKAASTKTRGDTVKKILACFSQIPGFLSAEGKDKMFGAYVTELAVQLCVQEAVCRFIVTQFLAGSMDVAQATDCLMVFTELVQRPTKAHDALELRRLLTFHLGGLNNKLSLEDTVEVAKLLEQQLQLPRSLLLAVIGTMSGQDNTEAIDFLLRCSLLPSPLPTSAASQLPGVGNKRGLENPIGPYTTINKRGRHVEEKKDSVSVECTPLTPFGLAGKQMPVLFDLEANGDVVNKRENKVHVVIVVDTSTSMQGGRLVEAKAAIRAVFNLAPPGTTLLSVISFGSAVKVVLKNTYLDGSSDQKEKIQDIISGLCVSGMTNMGAALVMAQKQLCQHMDEGFTKRLMIFSDGDVNEGVVEVEELTKFSQAIIENTGASIDCYGIGNNIPRRLLTKMANGAVYFTDGNNDVCSLVTTCFSSMCNLVGTSCTFSVSSPLASVSYQNTGDVDSSLGGGEPKLEIGDLFLGESSSRLVFVTLSELETTTVVAKVQYLPAGGGPQVTLTRKFVLNSTTDEVALGFQVKNRKVEEAVAIAKFTSTEKKVKSLMNAGHNEPATALLQNQLHDLLALGSGSARLDEIRQQVENALEATSTGRTNQALNDLSRAQQTAKQSSGYNARYKNPSRRRKPQGSGAI